MTLLIKSKRAFWKSFFDFLGFYPYGVTANDGMLGASLYDAMTVWFPDDGFPFGESQQEFVSVSSRI